MIKKKDIPRIASDKAIKRYKIKRFKITYAIDVVEKKKKMEKVKKE